jgi:DNA-binding transcriptional ArsR family regulator
MLEHLFGSKTRLKLLRLFFRESEKPFFVRELTRIIDVQINAVRRELELLVAAGLVQEVDVEANTSRDPSSGLRKYYKLNKGSLLYPEIQSLLQKAKILEDQSFFQEIHEKGGDIKVFLLTGSFTGDKRSPTDIFIVGNLKERAIMNAIAGYEKDHGSTVRFTFMTEAEFVDRRQIMDKFLFSIFEADNIKVVNELGV